MESYERRFNQDRERLPMRNARVYWVLSAALGLLAGCVSKQPDTLSQVQISESDSIAVFRDVKLVPQGAEELGELSFCTGRSEAFCIRKLSKKASKLGANAILVETVNLSEEKSEDFYPVLGRSLEREWTEITMTGKALRLPAQSVSSSSEAPTPDPQTVTSVPVPEQNPQQTPEKGVVEKPVGETSSEENSQTTISPRNQASDDQTMSQSVQEIQDAEKSLEAGQWEDALRVLSSAEKSTPDDPELHRLKGLAYKAGNQLESAVSSFKKARELAGERGDITMLLGNAQLALGRYQDAVASYNECLKIGYKPSLAYYNKAQALNGLGRSVEALAFFNHAALLKPDWPECYWNMAVVSEELERWVEANQAWQKYLDLVPNSKDKKEVLERIENNKHRTSK